MIRDGHSSYTHGHGHAVSRPSTYTNIIGGHLTNAVRSYDGAASSNATLRLTIERATFKQDADVWGKQDPFIRFTYQGQTHRTSTAQDAGKAAVWNREFTLQNVAREVAAGGALTLQALDDDTLSDDWLGATAPLPYRELVGSSGRVARELDLLDKKG